MRPGNINPVELLTSLPVATSAGACFTSDLRGNGQYIYYFVPTAAATAQFWRYDVFANTWQQLANPGTFTGTARFVAGCALRYDASTSVPLGLPAGPSIWLFHPDSVVPFAEFQCYNIVSNTWANASQAGGAFNAGGLGAAALAAQWTTDAALAHPCTALNPTVSDDFIYLTGNAATFFYRYTISTGTVAAMFAHVAAGPGCTLAWLPSNPDRIFYQRGNATNTWEYYGIIANNWIAVVPVPNTETYTTGTTMIGDVARDMLIVRKSAVAGEQVKFYDFNYHTNELKPLASAYQGEGTPHVGSLIALTRVGSQKYVFVGKQTSVDFQRVWIVE